MAALRLYWPFSEQVARTLDGHTVWVTSVALSPDDRTLAISSMDKTVRLRPYDAIDEQMSLPIDRSSRFVEIGDRDKALRPQQRMVTLRYWSLEIEASFECA
jgi:WD40 repeat protein